MRDRLTLPPSSLSLLTPCPVLAASVPLLDEETDATQREPSHSPLKPTKPLPAPPPPPILFPFPEIPVPPNDLPLILCLNGHFELKKVSILNQ